MDHGLTLVVSFFSFVQTSFREFGEVGLGTVHLWDIRFSENLVRVLGEEETLPWAGRCNNLPSAFCVVLLSESVSRNAWLQHCRLLGGMLGAQELSLMSWWLTVFCVRALQIFHLFSCLTNFPLILTITDLQVV